MKRNIYLCVFVFISLFVSKTYAAPPENTMGMYRVSEVYQEAAWLSMDYPPEQRRQIDQILIKKSLEVESIIHDPALFVISGTPGVNGKVTKGKQSMPNMPKGQSDKPPMDNEILPSDMENARLLKLLRVSRQLEDIRNDTQDEILKILTPEQQGVFNTMIVERKNQIANLVEVLVGLNMDPIQQPKVIQSLSQCQQQVWKIISNTSLSWDERRRGIDRITLFKKVLETLNPEQQAMLNTYLTATMPAGIPKDGVDSDRMKKTDMPKG
ncbi:MAG: hypothetical protein H6Q67_1213 [Firmicutes bacterium]|nr:hypothetical protein [Bacillota bacterium]